MISKTPTIAMAIALTSISSELAAAAEPFVLDLHTIIRKVQPPLRVPLPRADQRAQICPDIHVTAQKSPTQNGGNRVVIKVLNTSQADYVSAPGQQSLVVSGQGKNFSVPFGNLPRGGEVVWQDIVKGPGTYIAAISFDPDIFADGNPHNDDCRRSNNQVSVTMAR